MGLFKKNIYNPQISSKKLNNEYEFIFDRGWSPELGIVIDNNKVYLKLINWIGGEGEQPFDPTANTYYLGSTGFVTLLSEATIITNVLNNFIELEDVPDSYTGQNHKLLRVNDTETEIEFIDPTGEVPATTFVDLTDTPNSYAGQANKRIIVNGTENNLEFQNNTFTDLTDTANTYIGQSNKVVSVNITEDALEFSDVNNGLTKTANGVQLGGTLIKDTNISAYDKKLTIATNNLTAGSTIIIEPEEIRLFIEGQQGVVNTSKLSITNEELSLKIHDESLDNTNTIINNLNEVGIKYENINTDICKLVYNNANNTFEFTNTYGNKGIAYTEDYSLTYTDRTLVDKEYTQSLLTIKDIDELPSALNEGKFRYKKTGDHSYLQICMQTDGLLHFPTWEWVEIKVFAFEGATT